VKFNRSSALTSTTRGADFVPGVNVSTSAGTAVGDGMEVATGLDGTALPTGADAAPPPAGGAYVYVGALADEEQPARRASDTTSAAAPGQERRSGTAI
jgi:hypothetical protein